MNEANTLNRRALFRGQFAKPDDNRSWQPVEGLAAGSGDVFWGGWADSEGVFVAGDEGVIFHCDGSRWDRMQVPTSLPVHALWGLRRESLWAVGWMGLILHFNGEIWQRVRGGQIDGEGRYGSTPENTPLFAIDGAASSEAWAVGDNGRILRLDGDDWVPENSGTRAHLRCVRCLGDGRVLAGGADGTLLMRSEDGTWEKVPSPIGTTFVAALEVAPDAILLGGGRYTARENGFRGDLLLWDGETCRTLYSENRFRRLRDLAQTPAGIVCVGDGGQMHLLRDGRMDQMESGTIHDLQGLVPLPGGEALVVGDFGTVLVGSSAALTVFAPQVQASERPSLWSRMETGIDRQLWGLWTDPDTGTPYACGENGTVLILDRGKWERLPGIGDLSLHALARAPDGSLLAAGQLGEVHRYDGQRWTKAFDLMMDTTITSLWSDGKGGLFAAGDEGLILRCETGNSGENADWVRMASGTRSALYGLWGQDSEHVLAVGDFGLVLRWNGIRWDQFNAGTEHFLFDVWGRALDDIYIVGLSGTLGHFDGERWRITPARARKDLLSLAGNATHVMAVGSGGVAMLHDGKNWHPDPTGVEAGLRAVAFSGDNTIFAAGDGGLIIHRDGPEEL